MKGIAITKHLILFVLLFLFVGCATYNSKYLDATKAQDKPSTKEVSHTFYLIGDAGLSPMGEMNEALKIFKAKLDKADKNSTAIFLGDNIYPAGMPDKKDSTSAYINAKNDLDAQLKTLENFKGKPIFIPGNHDWYTEGLKGLKREQKYIQKKLDSKKVFFPQDGCPMKTIEVNDKIIIIVLDTEWYLTNWNKRPDINDNCEIKDRTKLFEEIEGVIKKNEGKTIVMAFHHPMFSYGSHGGQYSLKQSFYPKSKIGPVLFLGTFVNVLRRTTGASIADLQNKRYTELKNRLVTLAQYSNKVIFASGHEHTLQYIVENSTPQIVSGSGAKKGWSRLLNGSKFSSGQMGYAALEVYDDGSSRVRFYGVDDENDSEAFLFTTNVLPPDRSSVDHSYEENFPPTKSASIYSAEEIEKSGFFKGLWGNRYRKYYGTKVLAPTVNLDTLLGGLTPVRKGGGHQSKSLRLRHKNGKEYVMRALRKVSELYLQAMVFQDQYLIDDLQDSYLQEFLMDFYTGSHPYAPFTIGTLSDAISIYHTNPKLYYIPKQSALEDFNSDFGDELYMIEEHAGDNHEIESFGYSKDLKSTDAMFEDIRDDEKYSVATDLYLRARLFDMVLGDWDRHVDQWRWAEFKDKKADKVIYKPVPRDRDMAFSNMGDGFFMNIATRIVPGLKIMEGYNKEIRNVKGFNSSPKTYILDVALLNKTDREEWSKQAKFIQENLTEEVIDEAFLSFPEEVRDATVDKIKKILLARVARIHETADEYFEIINKYAVVVGTDKDDWFEIDQQEEKISIKGYRIIGGEKKKKFYDYSFHEQVTKEIWVYGLDDDDVFEVKETGRSTIKLRLIGGQNNDIYDVGEGKGTFIYDHKSKNNTLKNVVNAKVRLTDDYDVNTYRPLKFRSSTNQIIPTIGFNPDDGIKLGVSNTYTFNGFRQNPFTQKHHTGLSYYFATGGFEFDYSGEFANVTNNANLELAARFTSPNFAINFFGFGNRTENPDDDLGLDYNRVRLQTLHFSPALVWRGQLESKIRLAVHYEKIEVDETDNRFVNTFYQANGEESSLSFFGIDGQYTYHNSDSEAFPTMGMATSLQVGYKSEVSGEGGSFGYLIPSLSFDYKLSSNGKLVLATKWKAHFNIGDGYEFYQGATIGGVDGLRGFRNQRFTGKKSFYQNTDIRWGIGKGKTGILPTAYGLYGGFDYGRVWQPDDTSKVWHTSYGGGLFLNMADLISARAALFNSVDGVRFSFGLGFGF